MRAGERVRRRPPLSDAQALWVAAFIAIGRLAQSSAIPKRLFSDKHKSFNPTAGERLGPGAAGRCLRAANPAAPWCDRQPVGYLPEVSLLLMLLAGDRIDLTCACRLDRGHLYRRDCRDSPHIPIPHDQLRTVPNRLDGAARIGIAGRRTREPAWGPTMETAGLLRSGGRARLARRRLASGNVCRSLRRPPLRHYPSRVHVRFPSCQPYLVDLPIELALPRREIPRSKLAAGSVGVASQMTCMFPK